MTCTINYVIVNTFYGSVGPTIQSTEGLDVFTLAGLHGVCPGAGIVCRDKLDVVSDWTEPLGQMYVCRHIQPVTFTTKNTHRHHTYTQEHTPTCARRTQRCSSMFLREHVLCARRTYLYSQQMLP